MAVVELDVSSLSLLLSVDDLLLFLRCISMIETVLTEGFQISMDKSEGRLIAEEKCNEH